MSPTDDETPKQRLDFGPWRIDLIHNTVETDRQDAKLSLRAEALLLLLCRHANRVVTHETIHRVVWPDRIVEDAAISNCIWQIRKALGDEGKQILQTRAKRGYLLTVPDEAWTNPPSAQASPSDGAASSPAIIDPAADAQDRTAAPTSAQPEIPSQPADAVAPQDAAVPRRMRWRDRLWLAVSVAGIAALCLFGWWALAPGSQGAVGLEPDVETTVHLSVPATLPWARDAMLRDVAECVSLRGGAMLLLEKRPKRNPFAGAQVLIQVRPGSAGIVIADFSAANGERRLQQRFEGPGNGLSSALQDFLERAFGPATLPITPARDSLISARVAEAGWDIPSALAHYRRAVAQDPQMAEARLGLADLLFDLGRAREALAQLGRLRSNAGLNPAQRCRLDTLLVSAAPELASPDMCAEASNILKWLQMNNREALRQIKANAKNRKAPSLWLTEQVVTVLAHLRNQEFAEAEFAIASAETLAADAGWEHASAEIDSMRSHISMREGRTEEAARHRFRSAKRMRALGDLVMAAHNLEIAYSIQPLALGADAAQRRRDLRSAIDEARDNADIGNEIALRLSLIYLQRDDPRAWSEQLARIESMVRSAYASESRTQALQQLLEEKMVLSRHSDALDGVARLEAEGRDGPYDRLLNYRIRAQSYFAQDRLADAVAVVEAMEKQKFDLVETGHVCRYAWLFAETGRAARARELIKPCLDRDYDRIDRSMKGDYGVLAQARLLQRAGESENAWRVLEARIRALDAQSQPHPEEIASLAMLARHATALPQADLDLLRAALKKTSVLAAQDGASPVMRLGVHLLCWRLCAAEGGTRCGPVVPAWAAEEKLEIRLAQESAQAARKAAADPR